MLLFDGAKKGPHKRLIWFGLHRRKDQFSVNVVFFAPMDTGISEHEEGRFKKFVSLTKGQLRVLDGLEAIESSISGEE